MGIIVFLRNKMQFILIKNIIQKFYKDHYYSENFSKFDLVTMYI
jgi:hypothetical protein